MVKVESRFIGVGVEYKAEKRGPAITFEAFIFLYWMEDALNRATVKITKQGEGALTYLERTVLSFWA